MSYGLTSEGFVRKHLDAIIEDLEDGLRDAFGEEINLESDSIFGKLVGCFGQPLEEIWELAELVYNAMYPSTAGGTSLTNSCELVGVDRLAPTRSEVYCALLALVGTTITAGSKVATDPAGDEFQLKADVTPAASAAVEAFTSMAAPVANGATYTITINGTPFSYVATVPPDTDDTISDELATAINAGAEPVTATDLTGGNVQIEGDAGVDGLPTPFSISLSGTLQFDSIAGLGEFESVETGPVLAYAGTLTSIQTPISGWLEATNPLDADPGTDEELDSALRTRRARSLAIPGAGTVESLLSKLLAVSEVTDGLVIENTTDSTVDSIPPHAFEAVILGGDDDDIAETIWENKPAGIPPYGSESAVVTDSQGLDHTMYWSRPTEILMWVEVEYTKYDEEEFPTDGEDLIAASVLATGNALTIGNDVLPDRFFGPIFIACSGIKTLNVKITEDVAGSPGSYQTTPWAISFRELAKFDSGRIVVTEV